MSCYINGVKFKVSSFEELQENLFNFQEKALKLRDKLLVQHALDTVSYYVNSRILKEHGYLNGEKTEQEAYRFFIDDFRKRVKEVKATRERDPSIDFESKIIIYKDVGEGGYYYGVIFSENKYFGMLLKKQQFVQDYSYWDNTDKPDRITKKEWEEREYLWNKVIGKTGIYNKRGFEFEFTPMDITLELYDAVKKIPGKMCTKTPEKWALSILTERIFNKKMEKINDKKNSFFSVYMDATDEANTMKEELEKIKSEIEPLLVKKLKKEDVFEKYVFKDNLIENKI